MHPVFASNLLLHRIPALPFLAFFLSYSIHTSAPDHRFRKRSTPFLNYYFRSDHSCIAATADTTTTTTYDSSSTSSSSTTTDTTA